MNRIEDLISPAAPAHFAPDPQEQTVHEMVAVFDSVESLRDAITELQQNDFMRQELSFVADAKTVEKKLGHIYKRVMDIKDDPSVPRAAFMPDEPVGEAEAAFIGVPLYVAAAVATTVVVASGGTMLAAILAAITAGGSAGAIGAIFSNFLAEHHAHYIQHQLDSGGMLLWVHIRSPEREAVAREILKKHTRHDVHMHEVPLYS